MQNVEAQNVIRGIIDGILTSTGPKRPTNLSNCGGKPYYDYRMPCENDVLRVRIFKASQIEPQPTYQIHHPLYGKFRGYISLKTRKASRPIRIRGLRAPRCS